MIESCLNLQIMLRIADDKISASHHVRWDKVMYEPRTEGIVGTIELKPGSDEKGQITNAINRILAPKPLDGGSGGLENAMNFMRPVPGFGEMFLRTV